VRILVVADDSGYAGIAALFERWPSARLERAPPAGGNEEPAAGPSAPNAGDGKPVALVCAASAFDPALERVAPLSARGWAVVVAANVESAEARTKAFSLGAVDVLYGTLTAARIAEAAEIDQGRRLRKELRFVTSIPWSVQRAGGAVLQGTVIDLSAGGFKFQSDERIPSGEIVVARIEAPDSHAVPALFARILSSTAIEGGAWVRGRFVGLLTDEHEPLVRYLRSLARDDTDAGAALAALGAMTVSSLGAEGGSIAGVAIPKLTPIEKAWVAAGQDPSNAGLAAIALARCRANMIATVLAVKPPPGRLPFDSCRAEIGRARTLLRAHSDPEAEAALREIGLRLEAASRFLEGVSDLADERLASGEQLPELPAVAAVVRPAAPVVAPASTKPPRRDNVTMAAIGAILLLASVATIVYFARIAGR
jgi:hypothetical protein